MPLFELAQIKTADTTHIIIRVPLHYYLNQIIKKRKEEWRKEEYFFWNAGNICASLGKL